MTIEDAGPGRIRTDCLECGALYELDDFRGQESESFMREILDRDRRCPLCAERHAKRRQAAEQEQYRRTRMLRLADIALEAGLPKKYTPDAPPRPEVTTLSPVNRVVSSVK